MIFYDYFLITLHCQGSPQLLSSVWLHETMKPIFVNIVGCFNQSGVCLIKRFLF